MEYAHAGNCSLCNETDGGPGTDFTDQSQKDVQQYGYEARDLKYWAWILHSTTELVAVQRIASLSTSTGRQKIPLFLVLYLLRCRNFDAMSLRTIAEVICDQLDIESSAPSTSSIRIDVHLQSLEPVAKLLLIYRLIRHAARRWPAGLDKISEIICALFPPGRSNPERTHYLRRAFSFYNRSLVWLAKPISLWPMRYMRVQQKAQFRLLRQMTQFRPHLPISRDGYRALVSVQLTHQKTKNERRWADLKARSWPPWRDDKSGADALQGDRGSVSRALHVIHQMREAGYTSQGWEKVASVFAGWDTDGSPTIQTRKWLPPPVTSPKSPFISNKKKLWAARIESTRTIREAWSAFLRYEDHVEKFKIKFTYEPHDAMLKKLFHYRGKSEDRAPFILAGDAKETLPEPISPRQLTYVRTVPPTLDEFLKIVVSRNLGFRDRLLHSILTTSDNFETCHSYLTSSYPEYFIRAPVSEVVMTQADPSHQWLTYLSDRPWLLEAYLGFLLKFPNEVCNSDQEKLLSGSRDATMMLPKISSILHANQIYVLTIVFSVLNQLEISHSPTWLPLLRGYRQLFFYDLRQEETSWLLHSQSWPYLMTILSAMTKFHVPIDVGIFEELLTSWETFSLNKTRTQYGTLDLTSDVLTSCKSYFRQIFTGFDLQDSSNSHRPASHEKASQQRHLLWIPSYHTLHGMLRILGVGNDYPGILSLLHWMRAYATELDYVCSEHTNGKMMKRRTIIAIRVFLENSWDTENFLPNRSDLKASNAVMNEAKDLIQSVESWQGWPTDDEVAHYMSNDRKAESIRRKHRLEPVRLLSFSK